MCTAVEGSFLAITVVAGLLTGWGFAPGPCGTLTLRSEKDELRLGGSFRVTKSMELPWPGVLSVAKESSFALGADFCLVAWKLGGPIGRI